MYYKRGNFAEAIEDLSPAIEAELEGQEVRDYLLLDLRTRADSYLRIGEIENAISDYEMLIEEYNKDPVGYRKLAWLLATHPDEEIRNGEKALEYAEKAHGLKGSSASFEALAAAQAEMGNFATAVMFQQRSFEGVGTPVQTKRLEMYSNDKPYR